MTKIDGDVRAAGGVDGTGSAWFVLNANAEPALASLRFRLKDVKIFAAEEPFEAEGVKYNAGSFLIPSAGNPEDLRSRLSSAALSLGLARACRRQRDHGETPRWSPFRGSLCCTPGSTRRTTAGFGSRSTNARFPTHTSQTRTFAPRPILKAKYDVIIFPPVTSSLPTLINGVRKRLLDDGSDFGGPVPFKSSDLTPNLSGVDDSDDIRGGLGFDGLAHLKTFVENGGVFVPITASAGLPVGLGMIEHVTIAETRQLQANGSVLRAAVQDKGSPIAYGYDDTVALYFDQAPVFRVSLTGGGFGRGGGRRPRQVPAQGGRQAVGRRPTPTCRKVARSASRARAHAQARRARAAHRSRDPRVPRRHHPARPNVAACGGSLVGRKRPLGQRYACRRFRARRNARGHRRAARQGTRRPLRQ